MALCQRCLAASSRNEASNELRARPSARPGQAESLLEREEILQQIAAEVRRVVGIDRDAHSALQQALEVMALDAVEYLQFDIGERADRQRHALPHQTIEQLRVLFAAYPMVDAADFQDIECLVDVLRRALFAGVRDGEQPFMPGALKTAANFAGG